MLTIEEIVKNIKELNSSAKVELECINRNGLLNINKNKAFQEANKELLRNEKLIVTGICIEDGFVCINGDDYRLLEKELKYFRIKRPAPTFDDLIDVAVKAVKDKLIIINAITDWQIQFVRGSDTRYVVSHDQNRISKEIDFINSLYTETFVIESASDIENIRKGAIIELLNGNDVCAESNCLHYKVNFIQTTYGGNNFNLSFVSLKGATVTQKRGEV